MAVAIVCLTIIIIVCIICVTLYKCAKLDKTQNKPIVIKYKQFPETKPEFWNTIVYKDDNEYIN